MAVYGAHRSHQFAHSSVLTAHAHSTHIARTGLTGEIRFQAAQI
jgi:hypothetical protein